MAKKNFVYPIVGFFAKKQARNFASINRIHTTTMSIYSTNVILIISNFTNKIQSQSCKNQTNHLPPSDSTKRPLYTK